MSGKKVLILMGSDSDLPIMQETESALQRLQVGCELRVASAHRTPGRVAELSGKAREQGFGAIICGAGMSAHLGGVVASHTTLPVIGVPVASGILDGLDALLSTAQMPRGVPVACVGVGPSGAYNAGLLAAAILSLADPALARRLDAYRQELARKVEEKDAALQRRT